MSRINADFKKRSRPQAWAWWALAVGCTASAFTCWQAWMTSRDVARHERDLVQLKSRSPAEPRAAVPVPTPAYDNSARTMLQQRDFPWPAALTTLEATAVIGVTPTAIEAAPAIGQVRVEVQFTDYAKLLEYLNALNAGEERARWRLVQSHTQGAGSATAVVLADYPHERTGR